MDQKKLIFVSVILGVFAVSIFTLVIKNYYPTFYGTPEENKKVEVLTSLTGKLYLSLAPVDGSRPLGIYYYDIESKSLKRILVGKSRTVPNYPIQISPSLSDDGTLMVFARRRKDEPSFQIYTAQPNGTKIQKITDTPEIWKREPVLSPSKSLIAYVAQLNSSDTTNATNELPESWAVYLTDLSGKVTRVTNGVNPLFSPDGSGLLVLKNDGLHIFNIIDYKNPIHIGLVVKTVGGRASQTMKLSLSSDRQKLAWASPGQENIVVSNINSWENFSITPTKVIRAKAYWTAFSPDDKYLAVQEARSPSRRGEYAVLTAHSLTDESSIELSTLYKYDKEYMWLGGWVK